MGKCDGMVHLRRAHESDARAVAEVHVRTWQQAYRDLLPTAYLNSLSVEARERFWASELSVLPADRSLWLAEASGEVVGFASVGPSSDEVTSPSTGEIYAIYVLPECWDRGVGRSLLAHAMRDLVEHGYDTATLWVLESNERARRFYEQAGWRTDGARKLDRIGDQEVSEVRYRSALDKSRLG
jgi:ribosomal protein S18 acetylase RimI-like enzyme